MIVVADASPVNYLVQVEAAFVLPKLYGRVILPKEVQRELKHPAAPASVRSWVESAHPWIEIREPHGQPEESTHLLDPGERAAILLAHEIHADLLLIDEKRGRIAASQTGLKTLGTLGVMLHTPSGAAGLTGFFTSL
jgi:predicted nucleic acid-binding protein